MPTQPTPAAPSRLTAAAFAASGVLFLAYPAIRPSGDDAVAMISPGWVAGHAAAMLGFVLLGLAVLGLHQVLGDRLSLRAAVVTWAGTGLILPFYGAEDFGLNVIAPAGRSRPWDSCSTSRSSSVRTRSGSSTAASY